jgi:hypothetical protein
MEDVILDIIGLLEARKASIDQALVALREINDDTPPAWVTSGSTATTSSTAPRKKRRSKLARANMAAAQKKRWAVKKAGK